MNVFPAETVTAQPAAGLEGVVLRWVIAQNVDAPNFYMRVIEVQPGAATEKHTHAWEHEVYVLQGTGNAEGAGSSNAIEPGTCVYVAPNELHQFINTGGNVLKFICVVPKNI